MIMMINKRQTAGADTAADFPADLSLAAVFSRVDVIRVVSLCNFLPNSRLYFHVLHCPILWYKTMYFSQYSARNQNVHAICFDIRSLCPHTRGKPASYYRMVQKTRYSVLFGCNVDNSQSCPRVLPCYTGSQKVCYYRIINIAY